MPMLRVEICEVDHLPGLRPVAGATLAVDDLTTPAGAQPSAPDLAPYTGPAYVARLEAVEAPVYVAAGAAPDPSREPRMLVLPRRLVDGRAMLRLAPGERVAAILATDVTWPI